MARLQSGLPLRHGLAATVLLAWASAVASGGESTHPVDFARDVLPLLRRACFECHGPQKQEGGLRLDDRAAAMRGGDSGPGIVAGKSADSELMTRISLPKLSEGVMPARGNPLTPAEVEVLRRWIDAGAPWPAGAAQRTHWAYIPPRLPGLPDVARANWPRTAVDHFVLERLEQKQWEPAEQAEAATLVRRLYLDLIGIPPSIDEVDEFLADRAPAAYERLVDRLLASPQFGVRWARPWLDYARYADSHGFQRDDFRDLWPYRDWVVEAWNADMPFDRFTVEQLAGDLLPNATEAQRIATGFNRNAPTNVEAGSDPEETRTNQVLDRVNTLGMIWLGTTLECCQCHDHKYDPFTMRDYYGLYAFFNHTAVEAERADPKVPGSIRFLGPEMPLSNVALSQQQSDLKGQIEAATERMAKLRRQVLAADPDWEARTLDELRESPREHPLEVVEFKSLEGADFEILDDRSVRLHGEAPDRDTYTLTVRTTLAGVQAFKLEALTDPSLPGSGPGRGDAQRPNFVLNSVTLAVGAASSAENARAQPERGAEQRPVTFRRATADFSQKGYDVQGAIDNDPRTAWAIGPKFREPHWALIELAEPVGDGTPQLLTFQLAQNFGNARTIGRLRISAVTGNVQAPAVAANVVAALETPADRRSSTQRETLADYRLSDNASYQKLVRTKSRLETELRKLTAGTTLVMQELEQPRATHMFQRGDFRNPGPEIEPAIPAGLHPFRPSDSGEASRRSNRLDLAMWLMDANNPLTARVVVNRWWGELFGHGLVLTPEDFGTKGDLPTHPELLDWLAVRYRETGWSLKRLLREIVCSATYRQSSRMTAQQLARDDRNLWYARGARFRLDAEAVRDHALAVAGLLSPNQGGAPIRPYQPDGIWVKVGGQRYDYVVSPGEAQYRRGLYVVWKRGAPYPSFVNFDANNRMACRVQRPRSNTPLQALTLLNDPVYVEAARFLAQRVLDEMPGESTTRRLEHAFRLTLVRAPRPGEVEALQRLLELQREALRDNPDQVRQFLGSTSPAGGSDPEELAAWYAVAAALLNLDETITRN